MRQQAAGVKMETALLDGGTTAGERWLTAEEASDGLAKHGIVISPRTLQEHACRKGAPSKKINGRRRYRLQPLLEFYSDGVKS